MGNPKVFMDINMGKGGLYLGRIVIELYSDTTPRMAENFRIMCTGQNGKPPHYRGYTFRSYCDGTCCARGDGYTRLDLSAENFIRKHTQPGTVSMSPGVHSFEISAIKALRSDDGRRMVVGQVVQGLDVVKAMVKYDSGLIPVISNCGQLSEPGSWPRGDNGRMMSNSKNQLSDGLNQIKLAKKQLLRIDAAQIRNEESGELEDMANFARDYHNVLTHLKAEASSLEKHNSELLGQVDQHISNVKKKEVALEAIAGLPNAELETIESVIKKLKTKRRD